MLQIIFVSCKCSLVFSSRIGTEPESATINETLKELLLRARVNEHLQTTGILDPLYAESLTLIG